MVRKNNRRLISPTDEQLQRVLEGIKQVLANLDVRLEFDMSTNFEELYCQFYGGKCFLDIDDDYCPLEVLSEIAAHFDLYMTENRWYAWLQGNKQYKDHEEWLEKFARKTTMEDLVLYLAKRIRWCSFDPVVIFGRPCAPAGAFYGLKDLIPHVSFAPSTSITSKLTPKEIRSLWKKLHLNTGHVPAKLIDREELGLRTTANRLDAAAQVSLAIVGMILFVLSCIYYADSTSSIVMAAIIVVCVSVGIFVSRAIADSVHNPLPQGLETFGDLAKRIAGKIA